MPLTIASWNVNSIRSRLDHLRRFVEVAQPDVLCLQETKVIDDLFPHMEIEALGYPHRAVRGMKSYNGTAILSRRPFTSETSTAWCGRDDCRHLSVVLDGGIELHNFYVPAGGDLPDAAKNPKFAHKLEFLDAMADWGRTVANDGKKRVLVGDLNVAPLETDVWDHKKLARVITHTPIERDRLTGVLKAGHWIDAQRRIVPPEEKLFTWWSYRNRNWPEEDKGRRLDHLWISPALEDRLVSATVHRDVRFWEKPSDHAPVLLGLT